MDTTRRGFFGLLAGAVATLTAKPKRQVWCQLFEKAPDVVRPGARMEFTHGGVSIRLPDDFWLDDGQREHRIQHAGEMLARGLTHWTNRNRRI